MSARFKVYMDGSLRSGYYRMWTESSKSFINGVSETGFVVLTWLLTIYMDGCVAQGKSEIWVLS